MLIYGLVFMYLYCITKSWLGSESDFIMSKRISGNNFMFVSSSFFYVRFYFIIFCSVQKIAIEAVHFGSAETMKMFKLKLFLK